MRGERVGRGVYWVGLLLAVALGVRPSQAGTGEAPHHRLQDGAIELGFGGSLTSRGESVGSSIAVEVQRYQDTGRVGLYSVGAEVRYERVADLDRVDFEGSFRLVFPQVNSSAYLFVGGAAGVRQEWLGSFRLARMPVGAEAGIKALVDERVAITVKYEYRRVLDDPVADFDEHRLVTGISLLFKNESVE